MSFVIERGTHRLFGGSHRKSNEDMIRIPDSGMSIPHFRISNLGGAIQLSDCESKNGTVINGKRVTHQVLEEGAIFQAGRTRFQVRWELLPQSLPEEMVPTIPHVVMNRLLDNPAADSSADGNRERSVVSKSDAAPQSPPLDAAPPSTPAPGSLNPKPPVPATSNPNSEIADQDNKPPSNCDATDLGKGIDAAAGPIEEEPNSQSAEDLRNEPGTEALVAEPAIRLMLPSTNLWIDFDRIMRHLGNHPGLYAVAHLGKLADQPTESHRGIALFPHLTPSGSALPMAFEKTEWMRDLHDTVAQRLIAVDGLMVVLLEPSDSHAEQSLQSLGLAAIPGFSEQGGFVPWCWPSTLHGIVDAVSDAMIGKWFGHAIQAIIYPYRDRIFTYVQRDAVATLLELDFR
ncbi:MAG: FHA domain-containing protein [Pirellula sp.]